MGGFRCDDRPLSLLFPAFIEGFHEHTGQSCSKAVAEIARRIDAIHCKGWHFRPAIVARVLREFAKQGSDGRQHESQENSHE